MSVIQT